MSVSRARAIAFDILRRVDGEGAYASDLLHAELAEPSERLPVFGARSPSPKQIKPQDAALATELTLGVLRWQRLLDFLLERHLKKAVAKLDLPVAVALRLGLYQLQFLERVPPRAAVNESVELVKLARKTSAAPLVNAVLRRATEDTSPSSVARGSSPFVNRSKSPSGAGLRLAHSERYLARLAAALPATERLAILHSHPTWLVERWLARFGSERTLALLEANNRTPHLSCALNDASHRDEIIASLAKSGLRVEPGVLLKNAFTASGGSVRGTAPFVHGAISIQDEASQAIPLLLDVQPGDLVLDLCAAPGGKTPRLVRAAGRAGLVLAADRYAHRLRAMRAQFDRLGLESRFCSGCPPPSGAGQLRAAIVELDAEQPLPFRAQFDRILVDAPCSGTGTLARHPEIRWRLKPEQLAEFHRLQVAILTSALETLAPGGRLVYSTCSLEPEENEDVIARVLGQSSRQSAAADESALTRPMTSSEMEPPITTRLVPKNRLVDVLAPHLAPGVVAASLFGASGYFRTIPGIHFTDCFFAAVLEKSTA